MNFNNNRISQSTIIKSNVQQKQQNITNEIQVNKIILQKSKQKLYILQKYESELEVLCKKNNLNDQDLIFLYKNRDLLKNELNSILSSASDIQSKIDYFKQFSNIRDSIISTLENKIDELTISKINLENEKDLLKNYSTVDLNSEISTHLFKLDLIKKEHEEICNQIQKINNESKQKKEKIIELQEIQKSIYELSSQITLSKQKKESLKKNISKLNQEFDSLTNETKDYSYLQFINKIDKEEKSIFTKMNSIYKKLNIYKKSRVCYAQLKGKTLINVYQPNYFYKNKIKFATGFGDYIRGCYFLLQFSCSLDINISFFINHTISNFLLKEDDYSFSQSSIKESNYDFKKCLYLHEYNNWKSCIHDKNNNIIGNNYHPPHISDFLNQLIQFQQKSDSINIYLNTSLYPMIDIPSHHKNIMIDVLQPVDSLRKYIQDTLLSLNLEEKLFDVIHIRSGDSNLKTQQPLFESIYLSKLEKEIKNINDKTKNYLLISDSNPIKAYFLSKFKNIITFEAKISHFGEGFRPTEETTKNNLLDFYLMSKSSSIYAFSSYPHGSGFSLWCAITYSIPYNCMYVPHN